MEKTIVANLTHILVFKTNIRSAEEKLKVGNHLSADPEIIEWSIDLEDVDRVLRIVSYKRKPEEIIETITKLGYNCIELE